MKHICINIYQRKVYRVEKCRFLKRASVCISEHDPLNIPEGETSCQILEEHTYVFWYEGDDIKISVGEKTSKQSLANKFKTKNQDELINNASQMIRSMTQVFGTLSPVPRNRYVWLKIHYYDYTPPDYNPPLFLDAPDKAALRMADGVSSPFILKLGQVKSVYYNLALRVKSVLDSTNSFPQDRENGGKG